MPSKFKIENGHVEAMTMYKLVPKLKSGFDQHKPILVGKSTLVAILSGVQFITGNVAMFDFVEPNKRRELEIRLFDDNRQFVLIRQERNYITLEEYLLNHIRWIKNSEIVFDGERDYIDQLVNFVGYTDSCEDGKYH